ncbi:zinc finger protein 32-like, partial [Clarias magur]
KHDPIMEAAEVGLCSSKTPPCTPGPAGSQLSETCKASGGASVEHLTPVNLQDNVKKEKTEDEDDLCEALSGSVGHITPVDQQTQVKKEELKEEETFCGGTSNSVENVDEQRRGIKIKHIKKEESEDEDYLCTAIDWEMDDSQVQVFSCSWCLRSFTSQIYLQKHIRRCHNEEHERLLQSEELADKNHITTISSSIQESASVTLNSNTSNNQEQKEDYPCSQCRKRFTRQCNLQLHQRTHSGAKPYQCSECGKSFNTRKQLGTHLHSHRKPKSHQCSYCKKMFMYKSQLDLHRRSHTGDKPYQCLQCGRSFTQKHSVQQHQRVHL